MSIQDVRVTLEYFLDRITSLAISVAEGHVQEEELPRVRIAYAELQDELKSIASRKEWDESEEQFLMPAVQVAISRLPKPNTDPIANDWKGGLVEAKEDIDFFLDEIRYES